jgi:glycosyltransferase involved in cell wall biosynthesis
LAAIYFNINLFPNNSIITATYNRASLLATKALSSVQQQTDSRFEWIVINDGYDPETRNLIARSKFSCCVRYLEMPHPNAGFGLCHARNLGMATATGTLIAYLDDDNTIAPTFVSSVQQFFHQHPQIQCSMVQQWRQRDQVDGNLLVRSGVPFLSPPAAATVEDLLNQQELFDSNGFVHRRQATLRWNPHYRIFADYEFFLQCLSVWGQDCFQLHPAVLVNYVQRSDGVIGRSSYRDWMIELEQILNSCALYPVLNDQTQAQLRQLVQRWRDRAAHHRCSTEFCKFTEGG